MCPMDSDLLSRYLWFSEKSCLINKALSAARDKVNAAFADNPSGLEDLFLFNDLQLFLMQVLAFDGFVTACLHAVEPEAQPRKGPLVKRIDRLATATPEVKETDRYKTLRSDVKKIARVRNVWAHRLAYKGISEDIRDLTDRFGLHEEGGHLWVDLEHVAADGRQVWTFVVCTLHEMAELLWPCVEKNAKNPGN